MITSPLGQKHDGFQQPVGALPVPCWAIGISADALALIMESKRVNIEKIFHQVVRDTGGIVLDEKLPQSPEFKNADYVFHLEKVVAELKCLSEDNVFSINNTRKVTDLIADYHSNGLIDTKQFDKSTWISFPKDLQIKIYGVLTNNIKRRISKANRQIRETKENLKLDDYNGLLIIANDGVSSISPAMFIHATQMILQNDFHEIREFVYLTANLYTLLKGTPLPSLFWISFDMEDGNKIDQLFIDRLGRLWRKACSLASGMPGIEGELNDMEGFWNANHFAGI